MRGLQLSLAICTTISLFSQPLSAKDDWKSAKTPKLAVPSGQPVAGAVKNKKTPNLLFFTAPAEPTITKTAAPPPEACQPASTADRGSSRPKSPIQPTKTTDVATAGPAASAPVNPPAKYSERLVTPSHRARPSISNKSNPIATVRTTLPKRTDDGKTQHLPPPTWTANKRSAHELKVYAASPIIVQKPIAAPGDVCAPVESNRMSVTVRSVPPKQAPIVKAPSEFEPVVERSPTRTSSTTRLVSNTTNVQSLPKSPRLQESDLRLSDDSTIEVVTTSTPESPRQPVPAAPQTSYLQELHNLPATKEAAPETSGNYVADLNELLNGQTAWVLSAGTMLDLHPEEPEPIGGSGSYINDLRELLEGPSIDTHYRKRMSKTLVAYAGQPVSRNAARVAQADAPAETYEIPTAANCVVRGGDSINGLFGTVAEVRVKGHSTAPPKVPRNETRVQLDCPTNAACGYLDVDAPGYYFTSGYGVRRAPRNTHRFCNNPLYFEDANLERCGQSNGCLTTLTSAIHFTTMAVLLPYQTTANHPRECVAALPDCPTCHAFGTDAYFPEWSWKAAAVQAAAVTGLVFIIP